MLRKGDVGALQPKQQELVDRLFEANEKMVVMVNDLLNVSRIESGVIKPTLAAMDLAKLVKEVLADSQPLLEQKKQKLVTDVPAQAVVMGDALLTREVFANFVSNASKYTPDGGTVTVALTEKDGQMQVAVADTGIGIPKKDHGQMFRKFFRAENAAKSTVQGTGLGLYVCKSIVELSGGKIWFDSEEGKGTTFFFTLNKAK
jgi:signal transduction histidine kinase